MRYFIYCRKSSEAEDRQVASIESQLTTLKRTFGDRPDIEIVEVYEEAFSAAAPGRQQFGEMLTQIEKGAADGIIAWAPDRLARNSIDGGRIIYMLDRGAIRDLKFATYTFENNSQGKFMLQIMFGQSKYYSDALSDNVKRGNRSKIEKGWRPNKPPLGYLNEPVTRTIVKDAERFPRIRQIFDLLLSGGYSTRKIWEIARNEWDFRTPKSRRLGGRLIPLSYMYKILTNPFYAGVLVWNGRTYPGAHEPVVSLEEFERVQGMLRRVEKPRPHTRSFAFTGMIRCGECGFLVTAEEQINRHGSHYTYYHCTKRRTDYSCRQPYLSKANLEAQIEGFLGALSIPKTLHEWAIKHVSTKLVSAQQAADERKRTLQGAQERARASLDNLTSLRIRDLIGDDEFLRERRKLETDQLRLRQQLEESSQADLAFEPLETLISFRNRAVEWFRDGDDGTKRLIFEIVGSNPMLKDKIMSIEAKKPFQLSVETSSQPKLRAVREDIRTLWLNRDPELLEIIQKIRTLEIKCGIRSEDDRRLAA
ncbi:MAG: recombinase family protein [Pseudolabrys sp.]|nr:recombinase family protein [Pseudolabrys sp.]MDP2298730.1 recombinase family protein [Pseudolabrys sp.]